jgi:uncharacterized membrane protein YfcA
LESLLPDIIAPWVAGVLITASFFTSGISASFGMGGGLAMLALMGLFVPVSALIPVHGMVQLGSNTGRAWQLRRDIAWARLVPFFIAGLGGAVLAAMVVVELPDPVLKLILGIFVVAITWMKLPAIVARSNATMAAGGFVTTALTMFLGATGPLVIALFARQFSSA